MRHALVTGGAGFIGSHLVDRLLAEGWRVTSIDNFDDFYAPTTKWRNIRGHYSNKRFTLEQLDILEADELFARCRGDYDVIIHLAARAGVRPSIENPGAYARTNVVGTQNVLELARQVAVPQFVFASSSSVYGEDPNVPWGETQPVLRPISPYAATKVAGELMGHVYSHLHDVRFVALRLFTVYGPRQRPDLAIHKFARLMLTGKSIPLYGSGSSSRDYTYVGDIIDGIVRAIDYNGTQYEVINLGNDHAVALHDMVEGLEHVLGVVAEREYLPDQPGDVPHTWADIAKARRLLGYEPEVAFGSGLRRFAEWLREEGR